MFRYDLPRKKGLTDFAAVLILLSTFAGTITLSTQFALTDCKGTRVQALLILASQFFLASPFALLAVYLFLHRFPDGCVVDGYLRGCVIAQICLAGFMIGTGFVSLSVSILYFGANWTGPAGIAMTGSIVLVLAYSAFDNLCCYKNRRKRGNTGAHQICEECGECGHGRQLPGPHPKWSKTYACCAWDACDLWAFFMLEYAAAISLLVFGIIQVRKAPATPCNKLS
ncbi:hypothetical protein GGI43DRAFT_409187 [Trichoderma evansii]